MPEESPLDLDRIAAIDDPEELAKVAAKQRETAPATTEAVEAAKEEQPAAEEPPVAPAPPEPKQAADDPGRAREDAAWKRIRLLEKQIKEMNTAPRQQAAAVGAPAAKGYDDDPAEYLKARTNQLESQLAQLQTETQQRERLNQIRAQESEFERAKPDYRKALSYLEGKEIEDWQRSGLGAVGVRQLGELVQRGRSGDPQYKAYADHVDNVASRPEVLEEAAKRNQDPEDVAMFFVARDDYLTSRRSLVWRGAEATGRSVAEIAYDLALARGYTPEAAAQAAQQQEKAAEAPDKARERVLQQREISEATNSLSESSSASTGPQPRALRSRNEIINLADEDLDALITSGQYRNI